jgi:HNH endonuclease
MRTPQNTNIPLADGRFVLVDPDVYESVSRFRWRTRTSATERGYIRRNVSKRLNGRRVSRTVYLHRLIMGEPPEPGLEVDHINGDLLDCRRQNLRWVTRSHNQQNRQSPVRAASGHRNVYWSAQKKKWRVRLFVVGRKLSFGHFTDLEAAAAEAERARCAHFDGYVPGGSR